MRWICPSVAEMQIQVDAQPSCLDSLRQLQIVIKVVVAIRGIDPNALADRVTACIFEECLQRGDSA